MSIETFATAEEMADAAASRVAGWLAEGLDQRASVSMVIPGGRTPVPLLIRLAGFDLEWRRVQVTLSDERWVAPDVEGSNEAMVRWSLLRDRAAAARFVPLFTGAPTPEEGCAEAERRLADMPSPFEVAILGMGEDGHFASLFPGDPALAEALSPTGSTACVAAPGPAGGLPRLSLTLSALTRARRVVILATGEIKRKLWQDETMDGPEPPVAALRRQRKAPIFFLWSP